jgi:steroid delta-isomerase-like uncharacterized protein
LRRDRAGGRDGRSPVVAATQALDATFVRDFAQRWLGAWNAHDADALLAMCTEDVTWEDPTAPEVAHGHAAVREFLRTVWTIFPDLSFTFPEAPLVALGGSDAGQVWRLSGTFLGSDPIVGFAPTGKHVEQDGIDLYEFRDGLVSRYRALYDVSESMRQMGLAPPRGGRAERTMALLQRTAMRLKPGRVKAAG